MRCTALALTLTAALVGCAASGSGSAATPARPGAQATSPDPSMVQPTSPSRSAHQPARPAAHRQAGAASSDRHPPFRWHARHVTAKSLGKSWHSGCPVGPKRLRALHMTFWGFDHQAHHGTLIVRHRAVADYVAAFHAMYKHRFPIRRMRPVSVYGGSDNRSMRHDNTSAFNCRYAVANGPKHWSMHAYGEAVDINTVENPYELNGKVRPAKGAPYMDRSNVRPGMIVNGSLPVHAFAARGWGWGGYWSDSPDYQHFSSTGG